MLAGRARSGRFDTEAGFTLPADPGATHLVLRAARLDIGDAPRPDDLFRVPGVVRSVTYLGDAQEARIAVGGALLRVVRPTSHPLLAPGQHVQVGAAADAISWLATEPQGA